MSTPLVTKRKGTTEPRDIDKINRVVQWACEGITGVSPSEVILRAQLKLYDKIPTSHIHRSLCDTAEELITVDTPNYDKVAAKLYVMELRKIIYGDIDLKNNYSDLFFDYMNRGIYTEDFAGLSADVIDRLWAKTKSDLDYQIPSYGLKQMATKYCAINRVTGTIYETPQMVYFRVSLIGAMNKQKFAAGLGKDSPEPVYDEKQLVADFRTYYNQFAPGDNSLPSPIMNGVGTPVRQYSSCVGIDVGDSITSIGAASCALLKYVTQRAGIGLNVGRLRPIGEAIRNGEVVSTGIVNWIRKYQGDVLSCSQGGFRKSAATIYAPLWHYEMPEVAVLKDNTIAEERSARSLDVAFTVNGYMYQRLMKGGDISLFSPNEADGELYETFASDQRRFIELYEQLEADPSVRRRTISANEVFTQMLMMQRKETGRVYIMNIDHVNTHSAFIPSKAPIHFSNLCCVAGSERVVTDRGLLTAKELHQQGGDLTVFTGTKPVESSRMHLLREDEEVLRITLVNGMTHTVTKTHKVNTTDGLKEAQDLRLGKDEVVIQSNKGLFGKNHMPGAAFRRGKEAYLDKDIPQWIWVSDEETQREYIRGLYDPSDSEFIDPDLSLWVMNCDTEQTASELQILLLNLGIASTMTKMDDVWAVDVDAGVSWIKNDRLIIDEHNPILRASPVASVEEAGREDVYCVRVADKEHLWTSNGIVTHNCEITLPSETMKHIDDGENSEIFLCTLANINMGRIKQLDQLKSICYNTVRYLDDLLDYQDYPVEAARTWAQKRRALGIGINNYAYWLAKQGFKYGDAEALVKTHEFFEAFQYYLILASVELAKEKGVCEAFSDTKYSQGLLPIDHYRKKVDTLGEFQLHMDWEWLRGQVLEHGMRNSTLSAIPPSETSSQVIVGGSTNGVEPTRAPITHRSNKDISGRTLVPEVSKLKNKYDYLWDMTSMRPYLSSIAVMQKFIDQSISTNTSYNPDHWEGGEIPMSVLMGDALFFYDMGGKTLYYQNTDKKVEKEKEPEPEPEDGANKMQMILEGGMQGETHRTSTGTTESTRSSVIADVIDGDDGCGGGGCAI